MAKSPKKKVGPEIKVDLPDDQIERRRDDGLRRLLQTPPKPRTAAADKAKPMTGTKTEGSSVRLPKPLGKPVIGHGDTGKEVPVAFTRAAEGNSRALQAITKSIPDSD